MAAGGVNSRDTLLVLLAWIGILYVHGVWANPCVDATYRIGEPVPIGIAYWPGGLEVNWTGLHPCRPADRDLLAREGVQIALFKPSVDRLTFMRSTKDEEDALMEGIPAEKPQVLSLVAFHGGKDFVRSEARTIRSQSSVHTTGVGTIPSLVLILRLDKGKPKYLLWDSEDCYACGGKNSGNCIAGRSCAIDEASCVSNDNQVVDLSVGCNFTMPVAFSGTDKHSVAMTSGLEISRLGKYAVSRLMSGTFNIASDGAGSAGNFLSNTGSSATSNILSFNG
ncbi:hypothetical protein HOP50_04g30920 [Chloropicon primus]|uniref:Uncharacterized protein n=1 Tax=Chloropicon primus TaxID=1764295 RepID=A0A5B8MMI6_9CHLO|nr:hypothetical protein A3770_04p30900 [Chloropicon primus]UPQ99783.1 hypothetical protein HOP50_04g30920 [Chloropicon primus]|eukprot:QDZ20572.1 hypothetical protein A3770_04p30900 [Chloropicon primus]